MKACSTKRPSGSGFSTPIAAPFVEDAAIVAMEMAAALEGAGAAVRGPFGSGGEALASLAATPSDVALVAARLAADRTLMADLQTMGCAVVVMTASATAFPGSARFLRKPFGDVELFEAIAHAARGTP